MNIKVTDPAKTPGLTRLLWLAPFALGVWIRLRQIHHQILIDDEWHAIHKLMFAQDYSAIFLSFGQADHSIPLTLLFRLLADTIGLTESRMRILPLTFGIATLVALPLVFKPWLRRGETYLFIGIMATSPLLIYFSRLVRPYALTILLGVVAIVSLWRWWYEAHRRWASLFILGATLSAWLHPLTLLFIGGALTWFATAASWHWLRGLGPDALFRVISLGSLTTALCVLLVVPPLVADPAALTSKSGVDTLQWSTLVAAWELMTGSAEPMMAILMLMLAGLGAVSLIRRDRLFATYWLTMAAIGITTIALLKPAWIHHPLVLARYIAILLPVLLMLATLGVYELADRLALAASESIRSILPTVLGIVLLVALYIFGPLPTIYRGINQFTNDTRYSFDYDFKRNRISKKMAEAKIPEIYLRMMQEPGKWTLIETPWHLESHFNPFPEYQRQHQISIKIGMISGLCTDWTYGELRPISNQRISFDQFLFIKRIIRESQPKENLFVIFHLDSPFTRPVRDLPSIDGCVDEFRSRFGNPWYQDSHLVVFRITGA